MSEQVGLPFVSHSETSRDAAVRKKRAGTAERDRATIFSAIKAAGDRGMTDRELQARTGLSGDSQRVRRGELAGKGGVYPAPLIVKSGAKRDGCAVWVVA